MKRFTFLDWMRGLAVLLMIQCHAFNSFARPDVRETGAYMLSQFIGGMAAPLFLFMAGITFAFQMEKPGQGWLAAFRRGAYILGIAYLFRLTNLVSTFPRADWDEILKVDILNSMGLAMMVLSTVALFDPPQRVRIAATCGLAIAAASPVVANLDWGSAPPVIVQYLVPGPGRGRFAFFPYASYVAFGMAAGAIIRRAGERLDRLMQWMVLTGLTLVLGAQYFASIPYSLYSSSDFWTNSPALVLIRLGISLGLTAGAYLWTEYAAGEGWSWIQSLGRHSLLVYWVHLMLVYGDIAKPIQRNSGIPETVILTAILIAAMVGLSAAWRRWKPVGQAILPARRASAGRTA